MILELFLLGEDSLLHHACQTDLPSVPRFRSLVQEKHTIQTATPSVGRHKKT